MTSFLHRWSDTGYHPKDPYTDVVNAFQAADSPRSVWAVGCLMANVVELCSDNDVLDLQTRYRELVKKYGCEGPPYDLEEYFIYCSKSKSTLRTIYKIKEVIDWVVSGKYPQNTFAKRLKNHRPNGCKIAPST